jgi:hypothetical protein
LIPTRVLSNKRIYFEESFALVARLEFIRMLLASASSLGIKLLSNGCKIYISEW